MASTANAHQPTIILLSGYARAGKDTFARGIEEHGYNVMTTSVAYGLKEISDDYMAGLGLQDDSTMSFFNDTFKSKYREFLVAGGRFARSINKDVFIDQLIERIAPVKNMDVVVTDWRYLNEINKIREMMTDWRIITVYIETLGNFASNEEEALSIAEMRRAMACDYEFYFAPNSEKAIVKTGRDFARELSLWCRYGLFIY